MIVFLRCLYAALVSSARIVASADLFQRTREHPVGRSLVIAAREVIVERSDGLLVLLGFQILVRQPEPDKRVLRIALQYLLECLDARCGHPCFCSLVDQTCLPVVSSLAIVCNCMFEVPS